MKLYRTATGTFVGTQDDARRGGKGWTQVDVPTDKQGLLGYLNANILTTANDNEHPAYVKGRSDAEQGITTNPYSSPDLRAEWERGHEFAVESGAAKLPSFATITRGINRHTGKRR